jgi:hypothetical protein
VYGLKRYKSSATGKLVYGPDGEPLKDTTEIQGAIMVRHKMRQQKMDLLGLAAPKRSVHAGVDFDGELDQMMSQLCRHTRNGTRSGNVRSRTCGPSLAQAHGSGPSALTVLAGKAEEPTGHT